MHLVEEEGPIEEVLKLEEAKYEVFFGDLTKQRLDTNLVRTARSKELAYFESKKVWIRRTLVECRKAIGRSLIIVR